MGTLLFVVATDEDQEGGWSACRVLSAGRLSASTIECMDLPTDIITSGASEVVSASTKAHGHSYGGLRHAHAGEDAPVALGAWRGPRREEREEAESSILAPGATRAVGSGKRLVFEEPDARRTCFERDLDRIKYSHPFRRLVGKCQVFLAPDDVHIRSRMTHAIEVAQVSLSIANAVGLNPALCEAIALGHDCGHGPGGHASEDAFASYVEGGFDHAKWGADVMLAPLNLCEETLDGIRQHSWRLAPAKTPEGLATSWADRLAYLTHDADDAIRQGIITPADLPSDVREIFGLRQSEQIRNMITIIVGAIERTGQIGMPEEAARALDSFRSFNYERIYLRSEAIEQNNKVIAMLSALVEFYAKEPWHIPAVHNGEFECANYTESLAVSVKYVSGMTDRFAVTQAQRHLSWREDLTPRSV